ncbi:hypothetical protein GO730_18980 [Spirosoma sp. HMF3257]|uniref:SD-repeat containing protein B domain-containing protein n=1 Tax=Spirosoma telluris TaxID=2183553 RepID=A0A327NLS6_9BACT|nr:hypothetical protein [Spirosoma telluris]RAI75705.1 hypothetical protein HMF3257_18910 [Spirosoma telluris]
MALGGLALLPGYGEVLSTAMDPTDNTDANGLRKFKSDGSGSPATSTQIFYSGNNVATYGKGNGLGDVGLACNLAPIQIGNRVWVDSNNNGIQDPGEGPLAGVKVTLSGPGLTSPVSVTTNASGEYYFSSSTSGTAATGYAYSLTGLTSGSSYSLTFPTSASAGTLLLSNKPNSATGTNTDVIDTDPNAAGLISFTLGQAGENNFSYDAGYAPCIPPSLTAIASSNTVCLGTPITLTAQISPADSYTYTWSAPASVTLTGATTATATAIGLPTGTTTFTVTASSSPICSTLTTVSVTVNPLPTASLTSATICAGQSTTITATGGTSYSFSNGTVNTTGLLVVSPVSTTAYSVTVANASGCTSSTTSAVTVNPLPTASMISAPSATICVGQSVTLTATGGSSYTFSNGTVNNTGLLVVSPVSTTAYSVTVTNASGCKSTTTASVTVNPLPTASLTSATICAGQSTTITATGGTSYSFSNGTVNTTGLVVVSPVSTTAYSVTVANASGCRSTTTGTVTVMPQAVLSLQASATLVTVGSPLSLSAIGCVGTVNWSTGATGATLSVTPANPTNTYSATCTTGPGCFTTASITVNTAPPLVWSSSRPRFVMAIRLPWLLRAVRAR